MANYNDKKYKFGAENLTALNATQLTSGTVPDARFTTLPAVSGAALTALNASNLGSGTIPDARFTTLPAVSGAALTALNASNLGSGTIPDARFTTLPAVSGAALTALNASNLGSGTIPTARLGSGTASSSTVLYGDSSFKAEPSGSLSTKVVSGTRSHTSGSGNQAITGAGFTPTAVMLVMESDNETSGWGIGGTGQMSNASTSSTAATRGSQMSGSEMGCMRDGHMGRWAASLTSLDSNGATIYFTRISNYRHLNWAVCFMR
jgi:hypothetical protein